MATETTMTKPKVQELTCKEDLELLIRGDRVNAALQYVKGVVTFLCDNETGGFTFVKENRDGKMMRYYVEIWDLDVRDNQVVQTRYHDSWGMPSPIKVRKL